MQMTKLLFLKNIVFVFLQATTTTTTINLASIKLGGGMSAMFVHLNDNVIIFKKYCNDCQYTRRPAAYIEIMFKALITHFLSDEGRSSVRFTYCLFLWTVVDFNFS